MEKLCLCCDKPDPNPKYEPPEHSDFVCSSCVQVLINTPNDELKAELRKCEANGNTRKAAAIRIFTGLKPNAKKDDDKKRVHRRGRIKMAEPGTISTCSLTKPSKIPLHSGQPGSSSIPGK